jgi:hypothetical protein
MSLFAISRPATSDFTYEPGIADALGPRVLTTAELDLPIDRFDLTALGRAERAQIRYWQPATVGDLLFNEWD